MAGFGAYRDAVDIDQETSVPGEPVPDYSGAPLYADVPCDIRVISGDETYRGRQLEAHINAVVEMHALPGILPSMRLSVTAGHMVGRTLNIQHVRPVDLERGRLPKVELYCREVASV